jgi:hypothetical protein
VDSENMGWREGLGKRSRVAPETWIWVVLSLLTAVYAVRSTNPFWRMNAGLHFDDGYVTAVGERILDGRGLPYVDAASHRGPVMYWLAALAQFLGGRMQWYGVRALTNLAFLTSTVALWVAGLGARRRFAGALGAFLFVFISMCLEEIQSVFGLVGESIATPWLVVAFACASWGLARQQPLGRRCLWLGAAGLSAGVSSLCKQTFMPAVIPLGLWAGARALSTPGSRRERWGGLVALFFGWILPLGVVVAIYAVAGELRTFYYWFFRYNVDVYMAPFEHTKVLKTLYTWTREHGYLAFSSVVLLSAVASRHLGPVLRSLRNVPEEYARRGFDLTLVWLGIFGLAAGFSTFRMWPQYYLPPIPWFALLVGVSVEQGVGYSPYEARMAPRPWGSMLVVSILLTSFSIGMLEQVLRSVHQLRRKGSFADARPEQACEHIDRLVPPKVPIFIWGFDGDLYITCQHHAASRYVYSTLVAGIVPPEWRIHKEWAARDSVQNLISDLDGSHTPLILDSPSRLHGVSMTQIKPLEHYLRQNYCESGSFRSNDGRTLTAWLRLDLCPKPVAKEPEHGSEQPTQAALAAGSNPAN